MKPLERFFHYWKYPYLTLFAISVIVAVYLGSSQDFKNWVFQLGSVGFIGALIAGLLFVSSLTIPISIVFIGLLAQEMNPLSLALIGAIGSACGDYLILKLIREHLALELEEIIGPKESSHLRHFLKLKYIAWTMPVVGIFVLASPLPDELGVSLLGLSRISMTKFLALSYLSNAIGILMIASVAKVF